MSAFRGNVDESEDRSGSIFSELEAKVGFPVCTEGLYFKRNPEMGSEGLNEGLFLEWNREGAGSEVCGGR